MAPRDLRVEIMHPPAPLNENNTPSDMPFPTAGDQRDAQQALAGLSPGTKPLRDKVTNLARQEFRDFPGRRSATWMHGSCYIFSNFHICFNFPKRRGNL